MATITSRHFNHDVSAAKRSAAHEPVIITDRGRPSHVLLSIEHYRRLVADRRSIVDWLLVDDDLELDAPPVSLSLVPPEL